MPVRKPVAGDEESLRLSSVLAEPRQRQILSILLKQSRPLTDRDLAVQLAGREAEKPRSNLSEEEIQDLLVDLHHRYLPELRAIEWIDRRPEGIVLTEQFPLEDMEAALPSFQEADLRWEMLAPLLARPRRQQIVSLLVSRNHPLALEELAVELAEHGQTFWSTTADSALSGVLHHVDLPRLDEAGLIEYDPDAKTITRKRDLTVIVDWIDDRGGAYLDG